MKRCLMIVLCVLAASAHAGVTYSVQSMTNGMRDITIAGNVAIEGANMRMDVVQGDDVLFKDNSIVLSSDGGKTMTVFDPSARNYYQLQLDQLLGSATAAMQNLGATVKVSFENPHVAVSDAGDGGTISGFPTRKSTLDASYDIAIDAMGQTMTTHMTMTVESWTTDQLSAEFGTFLQARAFRTGIEALDKLIAAQSSAVKGLPLKQVSTIRMGQQGNEMTMVTTALISNIQRTTVDPSRFVMPSGYTKVEDPVSRMIGQAKQ